MKKLPILFLMGVTISLFSCNPFEVKNWRTLTTPVKQAFWTTPPAAKFNSWLPVLNPDTEDMLPTYLRHGILFGREIWYLNASDPRFQTDWLGQAGRLPDAAFFGFGASGGGSYATPYQTIKQGYVLIESAQNSSFLSAAEKMQFPVSPKPFRPTNSSYLPTGNMTTE